MFWGTRDSHVPGDRGQLCAGGQGTVVCWGTRDRGQPCAWGQCSVAQPRFGGRCSTEGVLGIPAPAPMLGAAGTPGSSEAVGELRRWKGGN